MRVLLCVCTALLATVTSGFHDGRYRPLVATREGRVRGIMDRSAGGHMFYCFKGIPYAQPPLKHLRFQPPQRHSGWRGIQEAVDHRSRCPQFDHLKNFTRVGDEDCLFANVYSRQLPNQDGSLTGLPVLVYIHGGGFFFGSGDADEFGPHYFMDEPVVLVTFNYRLGALGFFSTHDRAAPGNYGLLDQVVLLRWVQENIANFGGDPKMVTIFGQAAGGSSVSLQVLSPLSKDLFHHAISQSGMSFSTFAARDTRKGAEKKLSDEVGCTKPGGKISVDCIRKVPTDVFLKALEAIGESSMPGFLPRVDKESPFPFLPDEPRALLEEGSFNLVPWLSGITSMEGAFFLPIRLGSEQFVDGVFNKTLSHWAPFIALTGESSYSILDCGANFIDETVKVLDFYAPGNDPVTTKTLATVLSDRFYVNEISEEIRLASFHAPVYKYVLDHTGPGRLTYNAPLPVPPNLKWPDPELGVSHGDDLRYLFSTDNLPRERPGSPAYVMTRFIANLWANFARTGQPRSDILLMPDWPIFTDQSQRHMRLNSRPTLGERLFDDRVKFWQTVAVNEQWRHPVNKTEDGC